MATGGARALRARLMTPGQRAFLAALLTAVVYAMWETAKWLMK